MEFSFLERNTEDFQQNISPEQIVLLCQRAFGKNCQVESANELSGGLYNNTYSLEIKGMGRLILRVGPAQARQYKSECNLLRCEYASLPYFAPVASLLPTTLMADFTHQLIDRDYLFQSFIDGEQWAKVNKFLTFDEKQVLFRQLGSLTKLIHSVKGQQFNYSFTGPTFQTWSAAVSARLESMLLDFEECHLKTESLKALIAIVQSHSAVLEEIAQPSLLHGDLWLVNLLIKRIEDVPAIVGLIDNDRASWGDPLADWTMFLMERNSAMERLDFWHTYPQSISSPHIHFRKQVYYGCHCGAVLLEQFRLHRLSEMEQTYQELRVVVEILNELSTNGD